MKLALDINAWIRIPDTQFKILYPSHPYREDSCWIECECIVNDHTMCLSMAMMEALKIWWLKRPCDIVNIWASRVFWQVL